MKLNGVPIFHKHNIPLLVFVVLTLMYLVKSEQINLLFVIVPLLYIFRERLSELYIQETFPEKNTTVVSEGGLRTVSFSLSSQSKIVIITARIRISLKLTLIALNQIISFSLCSLALFCLIVQQTRNDTFGHF